MLSAVLILSSFLSGCSKKTNEVPKPNIATTDTSISVEQLQSALTKLETKYDDITKIYDDTLEKSINTYCEKYLSYSDSATENIEKIRNVVTNDYYDELQSQTGHQKSNEDYEQSTGVEHLYYENFSEPFDSVNVLAHCKQTVIYDDEVKTDDSFYTFDMSFENSSWKINSVSKIS